MRPQIFFLVLLVGLTMIGESFAQREAAPQEDPSLYEVSLQMQLRDADGYLITYLEPTTMYILNIQRVHEFLDTKEGKKIIEIEGRMYEQIEYEQTFRFHETKQIATLGMWYLDGFPLLFRTDGYLTSPGDTLDVSWKIVRTIQ